MKYLIFIIITLAPSLGYAQTNFKDLTEREQFAYIVGSCDQLLQYGNKRTKLRSTPFWTMHAQDVNDMITVSKSKNWTSADREIAKAAAEDWLAKFIIDKNVFEGGEIWGLCAFHLPNLIKQYYTPNFVTE